mmetsp:Transcript_42873/g.101786  ORF Transcript_42873/g.101786 Transcript_42873/m.101786 type:complete len:315 (+) Transcript_42873:1681-2625(+)
MAERYKTVSKLSYVGPVQAVYAVCPEHTCLPDKRRAGYTREAGHCGWRLDSGKIARRFCGTAPSRPERKHPCMLQRLLRNQRQVGNQPRVPKPPVDSGHLTEIERDVHYLLILRQVGIQIVHRSLKLVPEDGLSAGPLEFLHEVQDNGRASVSVCQALEVQSRRGEEGVEVLNSDVWLGRCEGSLVLAPENRDGPPDLYHGGEALRRAAPTSTAIDDLLSLDLVGDVALLVDAPLAEAGPGKVTGPPGDERHAQELAHHAERPLLPESVHQRQHPPVIPHGRSDVLCNVMVPHKHRVESVCAATLWCHKHVVLE